MDASALVKRVMGEPESASLESMLAVAEWTVTSIVADVEVHRAVVRAGGDAALHRQAAAVLESVDLVALGPAVIVAARTLESRSLRALDAIHLASALELGDELEEFVVYDRRLADAARALGLTVIVPA